MKQTLMRQQAQWALFLSEYNYMIIPTPEKQNTAEALSQRPDLKEGIAPNNTNCILLTPDKFHIQALHTIAIPMGINTELKQAIREAIETDRLTGQKLKDIILNGPHDAAKGLQEWNLEDRLILYKGLVCIPNSENLKRKVVQQYHDGLMGHPGEWKTIKLITRDFWWPGIMTFVKAYIKGCATCQTTKIKPPVKVPLKPNKVLQGIWETITMDFITDLPVSKGYDSILTVVDRHSKAIILSPCHKTITAE